MLLSGKGYRETQRPNVSREYSRRLPALCTPGCASIAQRSNHFEAVFHVILLALIANAAVLVNVRQQ